METLHAFAGSELPAFALTVLEGAILILTGFWCIFSFSGCIRTIRQYSSQLIRPASREPQMQGSCISLAFVSDFWG